MPSRRRILMLALVVVAAVAYAGQSVPAQAAKPQKLFALDADRGTLTPVAGRPGIQRLVLEHVRARALYFTDRPVREVGTTAVQPMLRALFAGDSPAPNAAVNATAAGRGQLLMGVELRAWNYDAREQRLTLRVRHLRQGARRTTFQRVHNDVVLPRTFHDVSLFIDDCCGGAAPVSVFNPSMLDFTLSVNNGAQLFVPGASPPSWLPGSTGISFSFTAPQPGILAPGLNYLTVTPAGAVRPFTFVINLPNNVQYQALQLYLFLNSYGQIGWTALNEGQLVASGSSQP